MSKDSLWSKYFNLLIEADLKDNDVFLSFPRSSKVNFVGSENKPSSAVGKSIYIRNDYKAIARKLFELKKIDIFKALLCGTPGVGKTLFRNYFAKFLLQNVAGNLAIIFDKTPSVSSTILFTRVGETTKMFSSTSAENLLDYLNSLNIIFSVYNLSDVSKGDSKSCTFEYDFTNDSVYHFFMFSSPNDDAFSENWKLNAQRFYLPLWGLDELLEAGKLLPLTQLLKNEINIYHALEDKSTQKIEQLDKIGLQSNSIIRDRFLKYGGNARVVLGTEATYKDHTTKRVKQAVSSFDYKTAECIGTTSEAKNVKHSLLYLKVSDTYEDYHYEWASIYVMDLLAEKAVKKLSTLVEDIFSAVSEEKSSYRGQLFECICHRIILFSKKPFKIKRLDNKPPYDYSIIPPRCSILELKDLIRVNFSRSTASAEILAAPNNSYLTPLETNFPIVDSIVKINPEKYIFFQITIAENHAAEPRTDYFSDLIKSLNVKNTFHVVYVVSPARFESFTKQILEIKNCTNLQYVMKITSN